MPVLEPRAGVGQQLVHLAREVVAGDRAVGAPQRRRGDTVGAGRATDAQIDAPRVQRLEHPEGLGDTQRRMVGQHDAAGAHPQRAGARGHLADHHLRRRTGHARRVVVLGQPVAQIAPPLGVHRQVDRVAQAVPRGPVGTGTGRGTDSGTRALSGAAGHTRRPSGDGAGASPRASPGVRPRPPRTCRSAHGHTSAAEGRSRSCRRRRRASRAMP